MITPWHNKDAFFKYYTVESAKLTLKNTSRKWSTPLLFNDPFDNQFDLYFEEPSDELVEQELNRFHALLRSPEPFSDNQFGPMTPKMEFLRQIYMQNPDLKYTEHEIAHVRGGVIEGMQRTVKIELEINAELRRKMSDTTIFCLSETHDNLLMWSHYAKNHTGAVIKFLSLPEVDSPLVCAQPVRYMAQIPRRTFASLMDFNEGLRNIIESITLIKSEVWSYEKEWRIIASLRNKTQTYEVLPYAPDEVGAVYLGCNIAKEDKDEIIEMTRRLYPKSTIFQAAKHQTEFALVFDEIT
jgi:hypothetical protein